MIKYNAWKHIIIVIRFSTFIYYGLINNGELHEAFGVNVKLNIGNNRPMYYIYYFDIFAVVPVTSVKPIIKKP